MFQMCAVQWYIQGTLCSLIIDYQLRQSVHAIWCIHPLLHIEFHCVGDWWQIFLPYILTALIYATFSGIMDMQLSWFNVRHRNSDAYFGIALVYNNGYQGTWNSHRTFNQAVWKLEKVLALCSCQIEIRIPREMLFA